MEQQTISTTDRFPLAQRSMQAKAPGRALAPGVAHGAGLILREVL